MIAGIGIKLKLIFRITLKGNLVIVFVQIVQKSSTPNLTQTIGFQDNCYEASKMKSQIFIGPQVLRQLINLGSGLES